MRYAEGYDYDFIYGLWMGNIDTLSILNNWKDEIQNNILSSNFLIEDDIGFCMFDIDKVTGLSYIRAICICEEERRKGYARKFIDKVLEFGDKIVINCLPDTDARPFCEHVGDYYAEAFMDFDRLVHNFYVISRGFLDSKKSLPVEDMEYIKEVTIPKDTGITRTVICRFKCKEDLDKFAEKNGFRLSKQTEWYDVHDGSFKLRKEAIKREGYDEFWATQWVGMPEFQCEMKDAYEYARILFHFHNEEESKIDSIFEQKTGKTCWYPKLEIGKYAKLRVVGGTLGPKYPIYVISKGRSDNCTTSRHLSQMEVEHYVVVEPSEYELYKERVETKYAHIKLLDMSYKEKYDTFSSDGISSSTGSGPARNFCWDDSIKNGFAWHWLFDDNAVEGFFWLYKNSKVKCRTGTMFRVMEDFVERYDNVAQAGINYAFCCPVNEKRPAIVLNTRIYSFLFIRNDIPFRWRGRYNEDTDLSLRILKAGWCTIEFNAFLAGKARTMRVKGGNTDSIYTGGTLSKSRMLQEMHPDVARVVWKFDRWHHEVDYSGFTQELHLKEGIDLKDYPKIDNYGMLVIPTVEKDTHDTRSYLEKKYSNVIGKLKQMYHMD